MRGPQSKGIVPAASRGAKMSGGQGFFVYILRCRDDTYYVGSTADVPARVHAHNAGRGPRYTACRRPVTLVYSECFETMGRARQREIQIKKWTRAKKGALITGETERLRLLSKRRT